MQTQVQRYNSLESAKKARRYSIDYHEPILKCHGNRVLYWNLPGLIVLAVMAVVCGTVIYAKYHDCDPVTLGLIQRHDQLMPYFVMDTMGKYPGLPGLFVACCFSGSLR